MVGEDDAVCGHCGLVGCGAVAGVCGAKVEVLRRRREGATVVATIGIGEMVWLAGSQHGRSGSPNMSQCGDERATPMG